MGLLYLEPPDLGFQLRDGRGSFVVDEDPGLGKHFHSFAHHGEIFGIQLSFGDLPHRYAGDHGQDPVGYLFGAHFQGEQCDALLLVDCHILEDVQCERRLTHRGTRSEDDELCRLESAEHIVQSMISGEYFPFMRLLGMIDDLHIFLHSLVQYLSYGMHFFCDIILGQIEDPFFDLLQDDQRILLFVDIAYDLLGRLQDIPQDGFLLHDLDVFRT